MEELVGNLRNRIEYYEKQEETRAESPGPDASVSDAMLRFEYNTTAALGHVRTQSTFLVPAVLGLG